MKHLHYLLVSNDSADNTMPLNRVLITDPQGHLNIHSHVLFCADTLTFACNPDWGKLC